MSCAPCLTSTCLNNMTVDPPSIECTQINNNYGSGEDCNGIFNVALTVEGVYTLEYWTSPQTSISFSTSLPNSNIYVSLNSTILTTVDAAETDPYVEIVGSTIGTRPLTTAVNDCVTYGNDNEWVACTSDTPFNLQFYKYIFFENPILQDGSLVNLPYGWACTYQNSGPASNASVITGTTASTRTLDLADTTTIKKYIPITRNFSFSNPTIIQNNVENDIIIPENATFLFKNANIKNNVKFTFYGNAIFEDCQFLGDLQIENFENSIVIFQNSTQFTSNIFLSLDPNIFMTIRGQCIFNGKFEMENVRKSGDIPTSVFNFNFINENSGNSDFSNFTLTEKETGKMVNFVLDQTISNNLANITFPITNRIYVVKL